jgi:hypothetical protein
MLRVARYHPAYRRDLLNWRRNSDLADTQNAVGPIHLSTPEFAVHSATGIRRRGNLKNPKAGKIRAPNTSVASIQCMYLGEWRAKCVPWSRLVCSRADPPLDQASGNIQNPGTHASALHVATALALESHGSGMAQDQHRTLTL